MSPMSPTRTIPIQKMKNNTIVYLAKDKKESSALLKGRAVEDYFGQAVLDVKESGKPIITEPLGYGISVSHSGGIIAVVITNGDVGIDIQERLNRDNTRLLSFFHESERNEDFYDLWTKKEAFGKMTGDGIFVQKGKKLETDACFVDLSKEISEYAGREFSATACFGKCSMQSAQCTIVVDFV